MSAFMFLVAIVATAYCYPLQLLSHEMRAYNNEGIAHILRNNEDQPEVYRSTYNFNLSIANDDASSKIFMPRVDLLMLLEVYSDGVNSHIQIIDTEIANEPGVIPNANDFEYYSNCEFGILFNLEVDHANEVYSIVDHDYLLIEFENTQSGDSVRLTEKYSIDASDDFIMEVDCNLPPQVSPGSCYHIGRCGGITHMTGKALNGAVFSLNLLSYEKSSFDFSPYLKQLSTGIDKSKLTALDIFTL